MTTTAPVTAIADPFAAAGLEYENPDDIGAPKSILMYALPGRRKTSIAGSIVKVPSFERGLFIDIDNGSEVLRNDPEVWRAVKDGRLRILKLDKTKPGEAKSKLDFIVQQVTSQNLGYDFVILDTLDVAQDVAEPSFEAQYATSGKNGTRDGFAVYRALGEWTTHLVAALHNCPWFLAIITAHAKEQTNDAGRYRVLPMLSGSSKDTISGDTSITAHLEFRANPGDANDIRLVAFLGESEVYITKNRYLLPAEFVDFDMPRLFDAIHNQHAAVDAATATPAAVAA